MSFIKVSLPRRPRLDTCPRKAVITGLSRSGMWYRDKVGETVTVELIDDEGYWAREGGTYDAINVIYKQDARLLPLEN